MSKRKMLLIFGTEGLVLALSLGMLVHIVRPEQPLLKQQAELKMTTMEVDNGLTEGAPMEDDSTETVSTVKIAPKVVVEAKELPVVTESEVPVTVEPEPVEVSPAELVKEPAELLVLADEELAVKAEPTLEAEDLYVLDKNETAEVTALGNGWFKVKADGVEGYIPAEKTTTLMGNVVVVDISEQHAKAYINGALAIDTPVITGRSGKMDTTKGVHPITEKRKNKSLMGGAHSDYWLRFSKGQGLHDAATWRSDDEYVPETYLKNGSHGCVNTPYDAMIQIYALMEVDDLVIVQK